MTSMTLTSDKHPDIKTIAAGLREAFAELPAATIILGSGLGPVADRAETIWAKPYAEIEGFPRSTAPGHAGKLIYARVSGRPVLMFQGRFHYYEGHDIASVCFPARLTAALGIPRLIVTNAAGGIPPHGKPGGLMLIRDHLSFFAPSALRGPNDDSLGPRFPDMTEVYPESFRALAREAAAEENIELSEGVYAFMKGPQFETPAEILALKALGADAVGMSTVPEAITAAHAGIEILGMSCITNAAAGLGGGRLTHEEVLETGRLLSDRASRLIERVVSKL